MTTLQEAARKALKALEVATTPLAKYRQEVLTAMYDLRTALAQQGEQQPVCHGCGIPAGDVHMSTCKSGKWPSRVSNGDTAAPAPQAQQGEPVAWKVVTFNSKTTKSFLTKPEAMNYLMSNDADWDWYIEAVLAAAPAPQAQEPARNVTKEEDAILRGALLRSGTVIHPKPAPQPAQGGQHE